jgi:anti-sigma regulatory factor (Ser/Thr protein kinase)
MSRSRAATVSAEAKSIQLQIDADARLAAAVGGAARYFAESAGLTSDQVRKLQTSIVAACEEAFEHLAGEHPHLTVTLTRYPDRIEVAMAHEGGGEPAVRLDRVAGFANQLGGSGGLGGVDRVQYEAHEGLAITRLTKYLGHAPHIA